MTAAEEALAAIGRVPVPIEKVEGGFQLGEGAKALQEAYMAAQRVVNEEKVWVTNPAIPQYFPERKTIYYVGPLGLDRVLITVSDAAYQRMVDEKVFREDYPGDLSFYSDTVVPMDKIKIATELAQREEKNVKE